MCRENNGRRLTRRDSAREIRRSKCCCAVLACPKRPTAVYNGSLFGILFAPETQAIHLNEASVPFRSSFKSTPFTAYCPLFILLSSSRLFPWVLPVLSFPSFFPLFLSLVRSNLRKMPRAKKGILRLPKTEV